MDLDLRLTPDVTKFETLADTAGNVIAPTGANLRDLNGLPCRTITVTVEIGTVRYRIDGGSPSATPGDGHQVDAGQSFAVGGVGACSRLQFYVVADATLALSFGF